MPESEGAEVMLASGSSAASWAWENLLRLIFPLTLPWVPLFLIASEVHRLVPEGSSAHDLIERLLVPGFLIASVFLSMLMYRLWPGFLRLPGKLSVWTLVRQIVISTLLVFVVLFVLTIIVSLALDPPPWTSDNPQYIPLVFLAAVFYPPLLTPTVTVVSVWRTVLRKTSESRQ